MIYVASVEVDLENLIKHLTDFNLFLRYPATEITTIRLDIAPDIYDICAQI